MGLLCAAAGARSAAAASARVTGGAMAAGVLGPPAVGALGVESTIGGGDFQRTRGRKE